MSLYGTPGTAAFTRTNGVEAVTRYWPLEEKSSNTLTYLRQRKIDLVINIPKTYQETELANEYLIRRQAADFSVLLSTNLQPAQRLVEALCHIRSDEDGRRKRHGMTLRRTGCLDISHLPRLRS